MPLTTNFNVSPYYDDFSEDKDFYRVLFRPGFGVQARELTQLQTLLQYQLEKQGLALFENGSKVFGADLTLDTKVKSLKLEVNFSGAAVNLATFENKLIIGGTSKAQGKVVKTEGATSTTQPTLMFNLLSANSFSDGETITTIEATSVSANTVSSGGASGISGAQAGGSIVSITEGAFFVDGFFVRSAANTVTLEKYSSTPTKKVGLSVSESIVDSSTDSSLLDNATGTTNFAAPGANRLKLALGLESKDFTATDDVELVAEENFIELLRVENGEKTKEIKFPLYGEIEKTLARRTFDESGDYTVRPFGLQLVAHKGGTETKLSAGLEPGKAYIKGYEYETISTTFKDVDKARSTETVSAYSTASSFGNKLFIKNLTGSFDTHKHELVDIHCVPSATINAQAGNANSKTLYDATKIGTARVRQIDFEQTDIDTANTTHFHSIYAASLYDIRTDSTITGEVDGADGTSKTLIKLPPLTTSKANNAYIGATLTVNTTFGSNTSSDTVTVADYKVVGGEHTATSNTNLTQNVRSNSTFTLSFTISDADSIVIPHSKLDQSANISGSTTNVYITTSGDVDELSKYNNDPNGNTIISDTNRNTLLFPFPYTPIESLPNGVTYQYKRVDTQTSNSIGGISFTTTTTGGSFLPGTKTLTATEAQENFIVSIKSASGVSDNGGTGEALSNGQVLSFATGTNRSIEITGGSSATVALHCNTTGAITAEIISSVQVANSTSRSKSLIVGNTTATTSGTTSVAKGQVYIQEPNKTVGLKDNLMISDIFNLVKVVDSQSTSAFPSLADISNTSKDITSNYTLDTGQRDNLYDHGAIILKPGASAPTGRILVIVDYFDPDTNPGFFSVQSYSSLVSSSVGFNRNSSGTTQNTFSYATIPTYTSPVTGQQFPLRDTLDFRPVRANANNAAGANTTNDINSNTVSLEISTSPNGGVPDMDGTFTQNINYYLGRTDKIVLTRDREFVVKQGVPSLNPVTPADDEDSMTLYTLQIPAYTFDIADIQTKYIDNRRFTMRDIGKLERRIENLEYYTSLSLLEKETAARDITSNSGTDSLFNPQGSRFKNGILVDPFKGHSIGDVSSTDYKSSIDFDLQELRPSFDSDNFRFYYNSSNSSSVTLTGNVVTLPYTSNVMVKQPLSSNTFIDVNPFNFVNFIGNLTLDPSSDTWFDTTARPDVLVNIEGVNDAWSFGANDNGHGSQWSDWTKIWSGEQINTDPALSIKDLGNTSDNKRRAKITSQVFTRTGIKSTNMPESIKRTIGNKVVDVSIVPFTRAQTINFVATNLKPSQNVFLYFDGTAANTTPASVLSLTGVSNTTHHFQKGEIITQGANTAVVLLVSNTSSTNTATMHIRTLSTSGAEASAFGTGTLSGGTSSMTATIGSRTTPTNTTQANTNLAGEVAGSIVVPASTFRSGERLVRVMDVNTHTIANATTVAEVRYPVQGALNSTESNIVSTRLPISRRDEITSEDVYFDRSRRDTKTSEFIDPFTQTFFVDKSQHPQGVFVNSVDLFFRQKATANTTTVQLPVTVQLRPIRNNLPSTNLILPFAEKTLRPEEVNAQSASVPSTSNTSHITTFTFDSPVYLPPDEYGLTVVSNSSEYQLWSAEEGKLQTGTSRRIAKQPNVGVVYSSQNQTVPIADPEKSIMFRVNRCDFTTGSTGTVVLSSNATPLSGSSTNVHADVIKINSAMLEFANTTQTFSYRSTNTSGSTTASYTNVDVDQNVYLDERIMFESGTASEMYLKASITSTDSKVSPFIDIDRMNVITIANDIDNGQLSNSDFYIISGGQNYNTSATAVVSGGGTSNVATITLSNTAGVITGVTVTSGGSGYTSTPTVTVADSAVANGTGASIVVIGETNNEGGNLNAKYITRKVTLEDGFDASDIKVILNAYKPQTAKIFVYAKCISADDTDTLDDKDFFLLTQETSSSLFSLNTNDIKEYVYKTANDVVTYTKSGVTYNKFKSFIVKVGMLSTDTTDPPRIKDLRAIALDE